MYMAGLEGPTFYDQGHNPISSVMCGQPYTFDVPGYGPQVWLEQFHNNQPGYSGPLNVPMNPYVANCTTEVGYYVNTVFAMQNGQKGPLIGTVFFNVLPMQTAPTVTAPTPGQGGTFNPTGTPTTSAPNTPAPGSTTTIYSGGGGQPGDINPPPFGQPPAAGYTGPGDLQMVIWPAALIALIFFAGRATKRG